MTMGFASGRDCGVMAISTALTNPTKRTANVSPATFCAHLESASCRLSCVMEEKIAAMIRTKRTVVRRFVSGCSTFLVLVLASASSWCAFFARKSQSVWTRVSMIVF